MKLDYSVGIVSFCPDLTARMAQSLPVGVLLVGNLVNDEQSEGGLAAVYVPQLEVVPKLDPMTREVLMSVAELLQSHVSEVVSADPAVPPVEIVRSLHDKLRNSLFVSEISDERSIRLDGDFRASLETVLHGSFARALSTAGVSVAEPERYRKIPELQHIQRFERPSIQTAHC